MIELQFSKSASITRIIGFDPGLADTGFGVIDFSPEKQKLSHVHHGVISTEPEAPIEARARAFSLEVSELFEAYAPIGNPSYELHICAEAYVNYGTVFWRGVQTLYTMGALFAQSVAFVPELTLINAKDSKRLIGVTDGEKKTVQARVQGLLGLDKLPRPTHAADALCIALARLAQLDPALGQSFKKPWAAPEVDPKPRVARVAKAAHTKRFG